MPDYLYHNFNKMSTIKNLLFILFLSVTVSSCLKNPGSPGSGNNSGLPNITGSAGEVLVVMDNNLWKSQGGNKLREALEQEYPALPQPEPLFDVIHIPAAAFDDLFKMHRTILILDVSSVHKTAVVNYSENTWARPQIVVRFLAPDPESLEKLILENKDRLISYLRQYDRKRLAEVYRSGKDLGVKSVLSKFRIDLAVPRGYNIDIDAEDFGSFSIESSETSQVIFIYRYPYFDKIDFSTERLIEKRNEFLKKYTKGTRAGSYMITASIFPPLAYDLQINGREFVEIRGLWELNKGYMGGPFISHSTLDSITNEIITVEAYVYNPNNKKRNLMRQMESIVYSFELMN
jgi:hypothetical protein